MFLCRILDFFTLDDESLNGRLDTINGTQYSMQVRDLYSAMYKKTHDVVYLPVI